MSSERSPEEALETLLAGVRRFRREVYPKNQERYQRAMRQAQAPHTLVITCADSRVDPELLTQSGPGDIFVSRNIGNLVPPYGEVLGGVSSVIEYAVLGVGVSQIVICGHTDCGAMKALLHRDKLGNMPTVSSWLQNAEAAFCVVEAKDEASNEQEKLGQLIEENVLLQMNHLRSHPSVAGKIAQGNLAVYGWVYDIGNGQVNIYDPKLHSFVPYGDEPAGENSAAKSSHLGAT